MTTSYQCDICGTLNGFETNNVVAHSDEKFADLCNECKDKVMEFIRDEGLERQAVVDPEASPEIALEKAKTTLKENGFVFYKPPPTRNRKKK